MGKHNVLKIFGYIIFLFTSGLSRCSDTKVQMRIVHDTANYGYFAANAAETDVQTLGARTQPSNFSGPLLFRKLAGHCFNVTLDRYQYSFCPFANMTQHELSSKWNAYQGVLGVWSHWKIENNTFKSMVFTLGDSCGDIDRSVEVILECGKKNVLVNVTEPSRCQYEAKFKTKYVCHPDALLVYPRLNRDLQKKWDYYWTDYKNGYVTEKGYNSSLKRLFLEAGLIDPISDHERNDDKRDAAAATTRLFSELDTCNEEYENLKKNIVRLNEEINSLKLILDLNKIIGTPKKNDTT